MSFSTRARRESALTEFAGTIHPDRRIDVADRQTLVGDYRPGGAGRLSGSGFLPNAAERILWRQAEKTALRQGRE